MLGVLKRHLKPKRAREEKRNQKFDCAPNKSEAIVPVDVARIAPSQRQVHPLFEEKAQILAHDGDKTDPKIPIPAPNLERCPDDPTLYSLPQLSKRALLEPVLRSSRLRPPTSTTPTTPTTPTSTFHPAPNICVEEGRIEFIKSPSEGSNLASLSPSRNLIDKRIKPGHLSHCGTIAESNIVQGVTRAQHTQTDFLDFETVEEKCDFAKEYLEAKIKELQRLFEWEQETVKKEKLAVTRLQRQLGRRDVTQRDVDRERRLRADTESRLRETARESERYRETLAGLQREFSKMEDTVRSMLQYKTKCELLNQEKVFLTTIYESRVIQYQNTVTKLEQENESLKQRLRLFENIGIEDVSTELLKRLKSLETENANLFQDADSQRKQYERCLDDIANQVVRALLSQKGLREEIGNLQRRIKELENQNHVLVDVLLKKLNKSSAHALPSTDCKVNEERNDSEVFLGAFSADICAQEPSALSFTNCRSGDKKRLQRLHLRDIGDKNIFKSLNSFESLIVVPLQRPRSLNLQLRTSPVTLPANNFATNKRCQSRKSRLSLVTLTKKPLEDEGNESPESGNRDEGYSTMSSDVQGLGETNELSKRELEDLKEASDETDVIVDSNGEMTSTVVVEDISNPDMFFIPLNLSLTIDSRQSYPPSKNFLPFQHAMRSFSDSHLCLKLTTAAVPSSASPSVFFLKKSKALSSFSTREKNEKLHDWRSSTESWCSGSWWDTEFFQHWLKFDDKKLKQQQRRDVLQFQYDRTEIEEWSMTLSCEDLNKSADIESPHFRQVKEASELIKQNKSNPEVGSNQWSNCNVLYPAVQSKTEDEGNWGKEENNAKKSTWRIISPGGSWCGSTSTNNSDDCCHALNDCYYKDCSETEFKDSPAISDDPEEFSAIDTDFTRDFYRLVKFESTKSLTSNSSKSNGHCDLGLMHQKQSDFAQESEMALQSVLSFIVEQQKYCSNREDKGIESRSYYYSPLTEEVYANDSKRNENDKEKGENFFFDNKAKVEADIGSAINLQGHPSDCAPLSNNNTPNNFGKENTLKSNKNSNVSTCESNFLNEHVNKKTNGSLKKLNRCSIKKEIITKLPVRNPKNKNLAKRCGKTVRTETTANIPTNFEPIKSKFVNDFIGQNKKEGNATLNCNLKRFENSHHEGMSEAFALPVAAGSQTSGLESDKISLKITGLASQSRIRDTWIPVLTSKKPPNSCSRQTAENKTPRANSDLRTKGTKIPIVSSKKVEVLFKKKPENLDLNSPKLSSSKDRIGNTSIPIAEGKRSQNSSRVSTKKSKGFESPTSKTAVNDDSSFNEKAKTKDVINELNKMIRKGEEVTPESRDGDLKPLDMACCCPTGWVHVERNIDFADPKARANLLDVMLASSGSSSESGSSSDSGGDEPVTYNHLRRLHRFRRQRKASATRLHLGVLRYPLSSARPTIIGRENFFVRFGDKEREAIASFDFLEDIPTTSVSTCSSCNSLESSRSTCIKSPFSLTDQDQLSSEIDVCNPITPTTPITPSDDSDERMGGAVSISDSCVESYPESVGSFEWQ